MYYNHKGVLLMTRYSKCVLILTKTYYSGPSIKVKRKVDFIFISYLVEVCIFATYLYLNNSRVRKLEM